MIWNALAYLAAVDRHSEDRYVCNDCGARVSVYNANAATLEQRPEAKQWDWWAACDNAECSHAYGEGLFQYMPDWAEPDIE